jgi:hypothetical protein
MTASRLLPAFAATGAFLVIAAIALSAESPRSRLQPTDIQYLGAFRLAEAWKPDYVTLQYSNGPLAHYPAGNNGKGSLFIAGHVYRSMVAEYEIPTAVVSKDLVKLPVARVLHPLTDVLASVPNRVGNAFIMSMSWVPSLGRIVFTFGGDYTDSNCWVTAGLGNVGSFEPTLSNPRTSGLWLLSVAGRTLPQFESGRYLFPFPKEWADSNVGGALVASGRHRNWCAMGPNLFAWTPRDTAAATVLPATPLLYYGAEGDSAHQSKEFSHADNYTGAAFLASLGRHAVAVTGIKDWHPSRSYYGYENWVLPEQCQPSNTCNGSRGWRAADPRPTILFFDPIDLAAVAKRQKPTWNVAWYAKLDLTAYALRTYPPTFLTTGADAEDFLVTFDADHERLYVSESFVDGSPPTQPIIHVFRIARDGTPAAP